VIGLDTNVVVRYVTQDDPAQARQATRLVESLTEDAKGFISLVVLAELDWVLKRVYGVTVHARAAITLGLVNAREIVVEQADAVRRAIAGVNGNIELADLLIHEVARDAGCEVVVTFDRRLAQLRGVQLLDETG
jgi:predicted nucleic-acid-binding protein